ncbi:MAG: FAD-dependent oxidoreductase [Opitutaceae bacterium]|nr:FAD-dependent oxidoreductase [Opitutaceae bacterium]
MSDIVPSIPAASHAWTTTPRREPPKRDAVERTGDFREVYEPFNEEAAREQAARCIQCPEPMCVAGCPLHLNIPQWLALAADGQWDEAARILHTSGCMPEIGVRLCPSDHLCEAMCVISGRAEPVGIWALEHFLSQRAFAEGLVNATVAPANGHRVAVLGADPGGLACADELSRRGYAVTVFDRLLPEANLAEMTPGFRLERTVAERRIALLRQQGVEFHAGVIPQKDLTLRALEASFAAVYLAFGARRPRMLDLPGIDLPGVAQARVFIRQHSASALPIREGLDVRGKRVLVVGGGDTALDCLRTVLRCGARQAIGVYRHEEETMPCTRRDYENAIEEGVVYAFAVTPIAVLGNRAGQVTAVRFARFHPEQDKTGLAPHGSRPEAEFEIETDFVFLALGYEGDSAALGVMGELERGPTGALAIDANHMTSRPGVFAGGDLSRGPCLALQAVRDGRDAAFAIDRYVSSPRPAAVISTPGST